MAKSACVALGCDVSLAVSGNAGPTATEDEVGRVWMATSLDGKKVESLQLSGLLIVIALDNLQLFPY